MIWRPRICTCAGICGRAMRWDWWSSSIPEGKKHEGSCCLCAKGSKANALLLNTWYYHGDMGWQIEKPVNLEEKALQLIQRPYLLGVHSSIEGVWGHGQGGDAFFFID